MKIRGGRQLSFFLPLCQPLFVRVLLLSTALVGAPGFACGLIENAADRLDSSEAEAVCEASCDRQLDCDDQFDVDTCTSRCGARLCAVSRKKPNSWMGGGFVIQAEHEHDPRTPPQPHR